MNDCFSQLRLAVMIVGDNDMVKTWTRDPRSDLRKGNTTACCLLPMLLPHAVKVQVHQAKP